ncbi:hypothetical protein CAPN001_14760 [Capnocytophaga stomatis]|uniref:glycosyltransferase family 2 protein n=1 Tax=Capnocytophaga stomatis TaxID=1848904 RepID=UPI001950A8CD|nr:glycosyltransferase family 2 protein [Capnocytophaga stomatis]GIJ96907.1 hypothetical protein CAPN001_14760 [Capnocytophaga stomatis]
MSSPLISIIVPIYNVGKHIKRCIDSLLCQTYENIEILIINDGSTDNTSQILSDYANEKKIYIFHQENKGVSFSRNFGIKQSKGDYICFVDGDDYVSPHYCEKLYENIAKHSADISICRFQKVFNNEIAPIKTDGQTKIYSQIEALSLIFEDKELQSHPWGKLFKKEIICDVSFPTDRKAYEDYVTIFRIISKSSRVVVFNEALYYYIFYPNSLSNNVSTQMYYEFFTALMEMYDYAKTRKNELPRWKYFIKKTARQTLSCAKNISIHKKTASDHSMIRNLQKEIKRFYLSEKEYIPFSIKWKFFLFLNVPSLYNLYISYKKT